jgi:hypothetical protein
VALGHLDGDGMLDAAVANVYSNSVSVLMGKGDGTFQPNRELATGARPYSVAIGDVDQNG